MQFAHTEVESSQANYFPFHAEKEVSRLLDSTLGKI